MRRTSAVLTPALALALASCAPGFEDAPEPSTRSDYQQIVGGTVDNGDPAVPLVAAGGGICTGTVISPHVVLTAAHCLGGSPNQFQIRFETEYGDGTGPVIGVTRVLPNNIGDIGVIAMASPAPVAPIPINTESLDTHLGEPTRIVGFGVTSENGEDSGIKRQGMATLEQVTLEEGGLIYTSNDPQGTCYGDSGGPNFMMIGGQEVVVGVTTTGTSICGSGQDIGSRVDTFAPWIQQFINEVDGEPTCDADGQCATGCEDADPDCPCADDGLCTGSCDDISQDPDCEGCAADGMCQSGCPDPDPDCGGGDDGPSIDDGGDGTGCCSASGTPPASAFLLALVALVVLRRRKM